MQTVLQSTCGPQGSSEGGGQASAPVLILGRHKLKAEVEPLRLTKVLNAVSQGALPLEGRKQAARGRGAGNCEQARAQHMQACM